MKGKTAAENRQVNWANKRGIKLNPKNRTFNLDDNLYVKMDENSCKEYKAGRGNETKTEGNMSSVHSSSALCFNVFGYLRQNNLLNILPSILGFENQKISSFEFEKKNSFSRNGDFKTPSHLDISIETEQMIIGIESKFTEIFSKKLKATPYEKKKPFSKPYFEPEHTDIWANLQNCRSLAKKLNEGQKKFTHLDAAQLIKHIIGMKNISGDKPFRLLYLWWYDTEENQLLHQKEVDSFKEIADKDNIDFCSLTYPEVIAALDKQLGSTHTKYIQYLKMRYLYSDPSNI